MVLSKEYILTLSCLKEIGVKGIGPKKIFAIGENIKDKSLHISKLESLASLMASMKEKVINSVYILGGNQKAWLLTEDGLYEVLMQSLKLL